MDKIHLTKCGSAQETTTKKVRYSEITVDNLDPICTMHSFENTMKAQNVHIKPLHSSGFLHQSVPHLQVNVCTVA